MSHYLVTGGAGFIGSNIVRELVQRGASVRVLDNFCTGKLDNLAEIAGSIELMNGDIRDPDTVFRAMAGIEFVLHQAALPSVPRSIDAPITSNDVNINGTLNILTAARHARVKRVVVASSSSVYGNSRHLPKHEGMATSPLSPYAVSKLAAERYALAFHEVYGLPTVALRYFNVYGPHQDPNSQYSAVIPRLISTLLQRRRPVIYGDGTQSRDFTYVANVVDANLLACQVDAAVGRVFNIACGEAHSLLELCQDLSMLTGFDIEPEFAPARSGDVKHSLASIAAAKRILGYKPSVSWSAGLWNTVAYYRDKARVEIHAPDFEFLHATRPWELLRSSSAL